MAIINYAAREMSAKIVYYGPGLSGKTTSIQCIHSKINPENKGKLVSLATETDRTLFFDFFPVDFGKIGGFRVKFNFYTVPGQVFYNTTRKLVLKGADGVVFVADSQVGMKEQNEESLQNLYENLKVHGFDPETIPFVIQYNKRDMPNIMSVEEMRRDLNHRGVPDFETNAAVGTGIMEAMRAICKQVLEDLRQKQQKGSAGKAASPSLAAEEKPAAEPSAAEPAPQSAQAAAPSKSQPAPAAASAQKSAEPAAPAGIVFASAMEERSLDLTIQRDKKGGPVTRTITLPLTITLNEGVNLSNLNVQIKVGYKGSETRVTLGQIEQGEGKKSFFARLFGG
jgi:signal recognition particle receptor subunit beta